MASVVSFTGQGRVVSQGRQVPERVDVEGQGNALFQSNVDLVHFNETATDLILLISWRSLQHPMSAL